MQSIDDHYQLQKLPDRAEIYRRLPPIWWSDQGQRWFVTNPALIRQIMLDKAFSVPDYNVQQLIDRLGIDLSGLMKTRQYLPLAWEGEKHRELRVWMTRIIAANSQPALDVFTAEFSKRLAEGLEVQRFCFVQDVLKPSMRATILTMAGYPDPFDPDLPEVEILPHFFDDRLSLRMRRLVNRIIHDVAARLPGDMSEEEKFAVVAIINVSSNTLLASLSQSVYQMLTIHPDVPSSEIDWKCDMPATGLPLIEKFCLTEREIAGQTIKPGDRLRLFIETEGLNDGPVSKFSDLFFAAGPHRCTGMAFSRKVWLALGEKMGETPLKFRILNTSERHPDYVFNFLERMEVETYV